MKILNLYAGIGGNRKLWSDDHDVTAVEVNPEVSAIYKEFFPNDEVVTGDAHEFLLENFKSYDFVWSSPPCTTHTRINKNFGFVRYADMRLYQEIILLKTWFEGKFCVENVIPYYGQEGLLIRGLPVQQHHRHLFWCNFKIKTTSKANPPKQIHSMKAQKSTKKSFIKNDDVRALAKNIGMPEIDKKVYLNGNHSPGQLYRNCVNPEIGKMILDCAEGIIRKGNVNQVELFE